MGKITKHKNIKSLKGNLIDVAQSKTEAIAVWMKSGFNSRNSVWRHELKERNMEIELVSPLSKKIPPEILLSAYEPDTDNEPWRLPHETLWKITNNDKGKLKYLYVFPNPSDEYSLNTLDEIDLLIINCLETLKEHNINSVSFILIPAMKDNYNSNEADLLSAKQMVFSVNKWLTENKSNMSIYFVDRVDDFKGLIN